MNGTKRGISFGQTSIQDDETPEPKRHQELEPSSYGFLEDQKEYKRIHREIEKVFIGEEERKFRRTMTARVKREMRREAYLDLQEENRIELKKQEDRLDAKFMIGKGKELHQLKEDLAKEQRKNRDLTGRLKMVEKKLVELEKRSTGDQEPAVEKETTMEKE